MADRVAALLAPALSRPGAVLVDATLGAGGHTLALAARCPDIRVIGIDRDPNALAISQAAFDAAGVPTIPVTLVHAVFDQIATVVSGLGLDRVDAVLFDLGLSSMQIDTDERGFAYSRDVELDMRMDPNANLNAADVVNTYSMDSLARVLRQYGDEPNARRIAQAIVRRREQKALHRTGELVETISQAVPARSRRTGRNPAKRTFQALRIEVNGELDALHQALPAAIGLLGLGGRIAVLAYHSLEDRMAKRVLVAGASSSAPVGLPVEPEATKPRLRLLTRGAERASEAEITANPRAAAARLRAAERIRNEAA
jgi:16S rRNA (cytosine1402-N4)-methyltransferase